MTALALAAGLAMAGASRAADRWEPAGPEGGTVVDLAFDASGPQTLYAGLADGGVWRSTDGAASWSAARAGLPPGRINTLAADPLTPGTLYVGRSADGVWKSTDGGASWTQVAATLGGQPASVSILRFEPGSHTLWAAIYPAGPSTGQAPIYRSVDGGAHWSPIDLGTPVAQVTSLIFGGPDVYVGTTGHGIFRSNFVGVGSPSGLSWAPFFGESSVSSLAFGGGNLFATATSGLWVSHDRGATWDLRINPPFSLPGRPPNSLFLGAVAVSPLDPSEVYAAYTAQFGLSPLVRGVYRSDDAGQTFTALGGAFPGVSPQTFLFEPESGQVFAAPGSLGVWTSADGLTGWSPANRGLRAAPVYKVLADPKRPAILYASVGDVGSMRSEDGGATWKALPSAEPVDFPLALDPSQPATVYAFGHDTHGFTSLFRGANGGRRWTQLFPGQAGFLTAFALDPSRPRRLYAAQNGPPGAIARSADGGATWATTPLACLLPVTLAVASSGEVYAGGGSRCGAAGGHLGGVERSDDGGVTFVNRRNGLPGPPSVWVLGVNPSRPTDVFAGLTTAGPVPPAGVVWGVFRSTDRADHWQPVAGLYPFAFRPTDFAFPPTNPRTLWLATDGAGVWRSGDGGASFRPVAFPGLPTARAFDLEWDSRQPATLYAATPGGLFRWVHE